MATTELIKQLREETGVSVMECKKSLEEAGGDIESARKILQKRGADIVAKKADRTLGSGVIASYIHNDNSIGVLVELLCETDFVARNEEFKAVAEDIAMHVAAMHPHQIEEGEDALLSQPFIKNPELTVKNLLEQTTQKFGENISLSRFVRYALLKE